MADGEKKYALGFDLTKMRMEAEQAKSTIRGISGEAIQQSRMANDSFSKLAVGIGSAFSVAAATAFIRKVVEVRGEIESLQISFKTLAGETKGMELFAGIKEFAVNTPMMLNDLARGAQTMMGFGIESEKVMGYLKELGDVSMGNSQKFQSLTLAFSQIQATGKLMGQDLLQLINAGFNPLNVISEKTGKSVSQLKDEMSKGAISAEMVADAFKTATSEGGLYYGMLEKQSKGIQGSISNLQGAVDDALNAIGESSQGIITTSIAAVTELVKNYDKVGKILASLIATYGAYKAALIVNSVLLSKHTLLHVAHINILIAARKAQLLLNAAMLNNPYVLCATLLVGVATAMWALRDSTTAAEKAQKRYADRLEEQGKKSQEAKAKAEELLNTINDTTAAEIDRVSAMGELKRLYPQIFEKYDTENIKLADKLELLRQINAELGKNKENAVVDRPNEIRAEIAALKKKEEEYRNRGTGQAFALADKAAKEIKVKEVELQMAIQDVYKQVGLKAQAEFDKKPIEVKVKFYQDKLSTLKTDRSSLLAQINTKNAFDPTLVIDKQNLMALNSEVEKYEKLLASTAQTEKSATVKNKSYWEGIKKEASEARDTMTPDQKGSKAWEELTQKIATADKMLKAYSDGAAKEIINPNSIKELENRISELKDKMANATSDEARAAIRIATTEMERQLKEMNDRILIAAVSAAKAASISLKQAVTLPSNVKATEDFGKESPKAKELSENLKKLVEQLDNARNESKDAAKGIEELGAVMQGTSGCMYELADAFYDFADAYGDSDLMEVAGWMDSIGQAADIFGQAIQGITSGDPLAVLQAGVNFISTIFRSNAAHKRALDEVRLSIKAVRDEYALLMLQAELAFGKDGIFGGDSYSAAINAVKVYYEALDKLNSALKYYGTSDRNRRPGQQMDPYAGLANVQIVTGHKKTGLFGWGKGKDTYDSILKVYPELIDANGKFNATLAESIIQNRKMTDENRQALQGMIDYAKAAEEAYKELQDYLTNIFGNVGNDFMNGIVKYYKDGTDAATAFKKTASEVMESLISDMIYAVTLGPIMDEAGKKMAEIYADTSLSDADKMNKAFGVIDKVISQSESVVDKASDLMDYAKKKGDEIGLDIFKPDKDTGSAQTPTNGGFQTMSQDTGSELNGRFTAVQVATEKTNIATTIIGADVAEIKTHINGIMAMFDNAMSMLSIHTLHLENIDKNTRQLYQMNERLGNIERNTKGLI